MNRIIALLFGVFVLFPVAFASEWKPFSEDNLDAFIYDDFAEARFLTNFSTGSFVTFNKTVLFFSGGIILWGIAGAMLLYYLLTVPAGSSDYEYDGFGYGESDQGGYSRSHGRSFNPYKIDWEKFSILEWISIAEESWRKFDPANLECQKRLICELHQNTHKMGYVAQKMVDAFSYLEFAEVLKLPEDLKFMIDDYLDAADRGRSMKKECGEIFSSCEFSVKNIVDRVTDNEI